MSQGADKNVRPTEDEGVGLTANGNRSGLTDRRLPDVPPADTLCDSNYSKDASR